MTLKLNPMLLSYMAQMKMGSSSELPIVHKIIIFTIISISLRSTRANSKCNDEFLNVRCSKLFKGYTSECHGEALQLFPKCLFMASECKAAGQITKTAYIHSANVNYSRAYDILIEKVKLYRRCFSRKSLKCNESMIKNCYENFEHNSTKSCREVHRLRFCILLLRPRGCHEMRNPWYTLAVGIIKSHRSCFIRNYTILLEAMQQKRPALITVMQDKTQNKTGTTIVACYPNQKVVERKWGPGYTFFGALLSSFVVLLAAIILIVCIKRSGIPLKGRRTLRGSRTPQGTASALLDARQSRTCVASGRTPLTFIVEEDEAPPPYFVDANGVFMEGIESPPPYTSRPTSVNGDFV